MTTYYDTLATLQHFGSAFHITGYKVQKRLGDTTPQKVVVWGACEIRQRQLIYCRPALKKLQKDFFENGQRDFVRSLYIFFKSYAYTEGADARIDSLCILLIYRESYNLVASRFTIMGFQVEKSPARMCLRASPTSQR